MLLALERILIIKFPVPTKRFVDNIGLIRTHLHFIILSCRSPVSQRERLSVLFSLTWFSSWSNQKRLTGLFINDISGFPTMASVLPAEFLPLEFQKQVGESPDLAEIGFLHSL